jgi:CheY-like chemotaxis protein
VSSVDDGLEGLRVFVVEDEFAVLLLVEEMLADLGCEIAASAWRVAQALALLDRCALDVAVLDVNVAGEMVYPVAEALAARKIPIVFSTGYGVNGLSKHWRDRPILQKPYRAAELGAALRAAMHASRVQ